MNKVENDISQRIMKKLFSRPSSKLFDGNSAHFCDAKIDHPTNLRMIQNKLHRNLYTDFKQWINEVHDFFNYFVAEEKKDPLMAALAKQMIVDFDAELAKSPQTKEGFSLRINLLARDFTDFNKKRQVIREITPVDGEPNAFIFKKSIEETTIKDLKREIKFLHSPDLLLRASSFIYQLQPEAIQLGTEISIAFDELTPENLIKVKQYVRSLLLSAAKGNIDPFKKTVGTDNPAVLEDL